MPISMFGRRRSADDIPHPEPEREAMLRERGLFAQWYIVLRLREEMDRARRYERPLAVMIAEPSVLPGQRAPEAALAAAAETATACARSADLIGWIEDDRILIVMPETDPANAAIAATRWRDEMWRRSQHAGGLKWRVGCVDEASAFPDAAGCIEAVKEHALLEAA